MNKEITTLLLTISSLYELYQNCVSAGALCVHVYHPSAALITTRHTHTYSGKGWGGEGRHCSFILSYTSLHHLYNHRVIYIVYKFMYVNYVLIFKYRDVVVTYSIFLKTMVVSFFTFFWDITLLERNWEESYIMLAQFL